MQKQIIEQVLYQNQKTGLTQAYQKRLNREWNKILLDPFAFVPHEKRSLIDRENAINENKKLGNFACNQLKKIFSSTSVDQKLDRLVNRSKIVAIGFGRNYDSLWVKEATLAGLQTVWIDVSDLACANAEKSMKTQWEQIPLQGMGPEKPIVLQGEIRSVLANPHEVDLEISTVEIWYMCRTLGCISKNGAEEVLHSLGGTLQQNIKRNKKIVIVNALLDHNPTYNAKTSNLYSRKMIISQISKGAQHMVDVLNEDSYQFFNKKVSALTIGVKKTLGRE